MAVDMLLEDSDKQTPRELRGFRLFGYTISNFAFFIPSVIIGVFTFQFYVYTVNLDAFLTSIGLFIPLILGGIFSPIFGRMIDNAKPGKLGKRRPFLLYSLPIWLVTNFIIFRPPWMCPREQPVFWPVAIYLWTVASLNAISLVLMTTAHGSLLPELSQTYENRRTIGEITTIISIIGSVIAPAIPLIVQSLVEDPENVKHWDPSGEFIARVIFLLSMIISICASIIILITFFSIDESYQSSYKVNKTIIPPKHFFKQIFLPLRDKMYFLYLMEFFFINFAMNMVGMLVFSFQIYSLKFSGPFLLLYPLVSFIFRFGWYFSLREYSKNKKMLPIMINIKWIVVIASALLFIFLLELNLVLKIIVFAISLGVTMGGLFASSIFRPAISSALIDEAAKKNSKIPYTEAVSEISGSYVGMLSMMYNIGPAIGSLAIGGILARERATNPTILTILMGSISLFLFFSLLFIKRLKKISKHVIE